jgi:hypothetical protein
MSPFSKPFLDFDSMPKFSTLTNMPFCKCYSCNSIWRDFTFKMIIFKTTLFVATLALGSWPKQGLARVQAKKEAQESHIMLPWVYENVREWNLTLPKW